MDLLTDTPVFRRYVDTLNKMFGDRESAREIKNALILSKQGKITDEVIEQFKAMKEAERAAYHEIFTEENPDYAFKVGDELKTLDNSKENDELSEPTEQCSSTTAECGDGEHGRDKDVVSIHKVKSMHTIERLYEV